MMLKLKLKLELKLRLQLKLKPPIRHVSRPHVVEQNALGAEQLNIHESFLAVNILNSRILS